MRSLVLLTLSWLICNVWHPEAEVIKCCLTTCVYVQEERCDPIIKLTAKRLGMPVHRVKENEMHAAGETQQNAYQTSSIASKAMQSIDKLHTTMADMLDKFQEYSDDMLSILTGPGRDGIPLSESDRRNMVGKLADINAAHGDIRSALAQQKRFTCSSNPSSASTARDAAMPDASATTDVTTSEATTIPDLAADGWVKADNGMWYKMFGETVTRDVAEANCSSLGARLAYAGIRGGIIQSFVTNRLTPPPKFYIGLKKIDSNWVWSDGVALAASEANWDVGQPSGDGICVELFTPAWVLNDLDCDHLRAYLCEQ